MLIYTPGGPDPMYTVQSTNLLIAGREIPLGTALPPMCITARAHKDLRSARRGTHRYIHLLHFLLSFFLFFVFQRLLHVTPDLP